MTEPAPPVLRIPALWVALAICGGLSACVHYVPRPRPPEKIVADFTARGFEDPGLRAALDRALPARQAAWPREGWDRADLLLAMLYFNDAVAQGRAAANVAIAAQATARERPNPTLTLASEYANQHDGSPLWLWGVATDWLLDSGARRSARVAVADLTAEQARYDFTELAWKTRGSLRRALVDQVLAVRELTLLEELHSDRASQLKMAQRQLDLGAASRGDMDRLIADALLDEQKLNDARRRASAARSGLAGSIGVSVTALDSVRLAWPTVDDPPLIADERLRQWRDESLLMRADVRSAVVGYSVAEEALRLEVGKQYPDVHLGPGYTWDHGIKRLQFNLGMTLPLLNRNQGAIAEAEARRTEAGAKLEGTVATAFAEIDEGTRQWQLASARLAQARAGIYDTAQRMYSQVERGFEAGGNDRTELVAAKIARTLTQLQVLDAVRAAQDALAGLEDALRRPIEGPELEVDVAARALPEYRR